MLTFAPAYAENGFGGQSPILGIMKKDIHPENYRPVVFKDMSNDYSFVSKSCAESSETIKWEDGNEYPLIKLEISHKSHPYFTGKMKLVDTAGRIDKFNKRYGKYKKGAAEKAAPETSTPDADETKEESTES